MLTRTTYHVNSLVLPYIPGMFEILCAFIATGGPGSFATFVTVRSERLT